MTQVDVEFRNESLKQAQAQSALLRAAPEEGMTRLLAQMRAGNLLLAATFTRGVYEVFVRDLFEVMVKERLKLQGKMQEEGKGRGEAR